MFDWVTRLFQSELRHGSDKSVAELIEASKRQSFRDRLVENLRKYGEVCQQQRQKTQRLDTEIALIKEDVSVLTVRIKAADDVQAKSMVQDILQKEAKLKELQDKLVLSKQSEKVALADLDKSLAELKELEQEFADAQSTIELSKLKSLTSDLQAELKEANKSATLQAAVAARQELTPDPNQEFLSAGEDEAVAKRLAELRRD